MEVIKIRFVIVVLLFGQTSLLYGQTTPACVPLINNLSQDKNYKVTYSPRIPIIDRNVLKNKNTCEVMQTVEYTDDLGRPLQTIQIKASPGASKDIIQAFEYDLNGKELNQYLPYTFSSNGLYQPNALLSGSGVHDFYAFPPAGIISTSHPKSEIVLDGSPMERIVEKGAPGISWSIGSGHTVKSEQLTNDGMGEQRAVRHYYSASASGLLSERGSYTPGSLYITVAKNENWVAGLAGTTETYIDKLGNTILNRIWESNAISLSTYYVYDELGNLCFVLPPGANPDQGSVSQAAIDDFCYQYRYDGRKRVVQKKFPGKDWNYFIYNKYDQLVLSQDANQRLINQWMFYKYDKKGRQIITGLFENSSSVSALQSSINGQSSFFEARDNININGTSIGYTNSTFPLHPSVSVYLVVNYYDDYSFYGNTFGRPSSNQRQENIDIVTASKINTTGSQNMLLNVSYFDEYGRLAQSKAQNHISGTDISDYTYNFNGQLVSMVRVHAALDVSTRISSNYSYDNMGRQLKTMKSINGANPVVLSERIYNEVGQIIEKKLHDGLQSSIYSYNERGWLKKSISSQFSLELKYQDSEYPQYNGNISGQTWGTGVSLNNSFIYLYDKLNRLTNASSTGITMSEALAFDHMGNIRSLNRDGGGARVYNYTGNRLDQVTGLTGPYGYDANGNTIQDGRTGALLTYNFMNLPLTAIGTGINSAYTYDALGNKLKKVSEGQVKDYVGGIEYTNGIIDIIQTEEGVVRNNGGTFTFEYYIADHLGNNRVVFYKNPNTQQLEILQQDDYYAFGLRKSSAFGNNKYLYNGKELQEELGQLDYGARFYDPVIGRWNVIDPLSELDRKTSPYAYVFNNPLRFIDPTGMKGESTHTDIFGTVLGIYNDGDLGVYRHKNVKSEEDMDKVYYGIASSSAGGEKMGETWTPFGFADFGNFEKNGPDRYGKVKHAKGAFIDFRSSWAQGEVKEILGNSPSAYKYSTMAGSNQDWDIKSKVPAGRNSAYGSLLWGKYASARDAGNMVAGIVAENSYFPTIVIDYGFGQYNQSGNNKRTAIGLGIRDIIMSSILPPVGIYQFLKTALTGEDKLTRDGINAGKKIFR